jgi:hypothetical protein
MELKMNTPGKLYALLVGINQYENPMMQGLKYAVRDVRAFRELARDRMALDDEHCRILTSPVSESGIAPRRLELLSELDRFTRAPMGPDDVFLFVFAGHGFSIGESSYLMTSDANPNSELLVRDTAVPFDLLQAYCQRIKAGKQIIILDACRNAVTAHSRGAPVSMGSTMTRDISALAGLTASAASAGPSRAVISSCWEGQVSFEYEKAEQGWFCFNFLECLRRHPGPMTSVASLVEQVGACMIEKAWRLFPEAAMQRPHLALYGESMALSLVPLAATAKPVAEDPAQVTIVEPEVSPIRVDVEHISVGQLVSGKIPPMPLEILEMEGEFEGLKLALEQLQSNKHPSLAQGQTAIAEAEAQAKQQNDILSHNTPALSAGLINSIRACIASDVAYSVAKLCEMASDVPSAVLLPYIHRLKNAEKARLIVHKVTQRFEASKSEKIKELTDRLQTLEASIKERKTEDLEAVLNIFLAEHGNTDEFPLEAWIEYEPLLRARRYPLSALEILKLAEEPFRAPSDPVVPTESIADRLQSPGATASGARSEKTKQHNGVPPVPPPCPKRHDSNMTWLAVVIILALIFWSFVGLGFLAALLGLE